MKKLLLLILLLVGSVNLFAQVQIISPHPDLRFDFQESSLIDGNLAIDMMVTYSGKKGKVTFPGTEWMSPSVAYDDQGNIYAYNKNGKIEIAAAGSAYTDFQSIVLVKEVPVKLSIRISGINPNASGFLLIRIAVSSKGKLNIKEPLEIRDLVFER